MILFMGESPVFKAKKNLKVFHPELLILLKELRPHNGK